MRTWVVSGVLLLSACISQTLKSSGSHVDSGQAALDAGDLDQAEAEYRQATYRAEGNAWALVEGRRGLGRVEIARMKARLPELRGMTTPPAEAIAAVQAERLKLRELGGDAELDALLVIVVGEHADRWVTAEEARAQSGQAYQAAHAITPLLSVRDLTESIVARATNLRATAGAQAELRATSAGPSHPLAQRLHRGHAGALGLAPVPDGRELLGPYARSVALQLTAADGCPSAALRADIAIPGTSRLATVTVDLASCTTATTSSPSTDLAVWDEQVLVGYRTEYVPERRCVQRCGSVLTGGETCNTSYQYSPPMRVCTPNTRTSCVDECTTVQAPKQVPDYRAVRREQRRMLTTDTTTASIAGTWKVVREGVERAGTFAITERSEYGFAPAVGDAPSKVVGTKRSESEVAGLAYASMRSTLRSALDELFAADIAEAVAAAQAVASKLDDEEEQWTRAVLLGGKDLGPLAQRYDLDRDALLALFGPQAFEAKPPDELPPATTFSTHARVEGSQIVKADYDELAADYLPSFGGRYSLTFEASYRALPTVMTAGGSEAGGDSAALVGIRGSTKALGFVLKRPYFGFQVVDELAGALALGGRISGPMVIDNSLSFAAATFSMHYAIGAGYRLPGKGGVFAGLRASYEGFLLGTSTGSYTTVPLFARAELPLVYGTVAIEGSALSLAGGDNVGLSVHWANLRPWSRPSPGKYFQLRIERTTTDATSTDFGDTAAANGDRQLEDVELTSVIFLYGRGW